MSKVIEWILKSRGAKVGGTVLGGGSLLTVVFFLHQDIKFEIAQAETRAKDYAEGQAMHAAKGFGLKLDNISENQREIKEMVKIIDRRLYNLKTNN